MFSDFFILFEEFIQLNQELARAIKKSQSNAYVPNSFLGDESAKDYIIRSIHDIWYQDGQEPKETRKYIGFVHVGEDIALVKQLNAIKVQLQKAYQLISKEQSFNKIYSTDRFSDLSKRSPRPEEFRRHGLTRLCFNHIFRQLLFYEQTVASISFSIEKKGWSERPITKSALLARISRDFEGSEKEMLYRSKIEALSDSASIVMAYPQKPSIRANVVMLGAKKRQTPRASMPIFLGDNSVLPRTNSSFTFDVHEDFRLSRSDKKLSSEPLIENTHYYLTRSNG